MSLLRWLGGVGCLCLLTLSANAQPTIATFSGPSDTNYVQYGNGTGFVFNDGPAGPDQNYFRLTFPGQASTNNILAFDLTSPGPTAHVIGDFDFRIGGTPGTHADGVGVALIPTSIYGATGPGPGITEEGSQGAGDMSIGFGLDTYNNGSPGDIGNSSLPNGTDSSELSLNTNLPHGYFIYNVDMWGAYQYNLHQDFVDDTATPFDHCHFTVDIDPNGGGATVAVTITSNQGDLTGGTPFQAIQAVIPGILPYEMRLGIGARTGGANDGHDIANVVVSFSQ